MHLMNHFNRNYPLPVGSDAVSGGGADGGAGVGLLSPPHSGELWRPEVHLPAVHVQGQHHGQGRDDGQDVLLPRRHQQRSGGIGFIEIFSLIIIEIFSNYS